MMLYVIYPYRSIIHMYYRVVVAVHTLFTTKMYPQGAMFRQIPSNRTKGLVIPSVFLPWKFLVQ